MAQDNNQNLENEETVENIDNNVEETGNVGTQPTENNEEKKGKTFTQEEVNAMLNKEKKKYNAKLPDAETMKKFKEWQESQKSAEQKQAERETEYNKALESIKEKNNYIAVLESGVNKEDSDYVLYKVSKMDGDFEENLEEFLKSNPKFLNSKKANNDADDEDNTTNGVSVKSGNNKNLSGVDAILKRKHPELFK